jgi:hypothetical protein
MSLESIFPCMGHIALGSSKRLLASYILARRHPVCFFSRSKDERHETREETSECGHFYESENMKSMKVCIDVM